MSFFTALYNLLIGPLELFFEVLFSFVNQVVDNPGFSIIFLSLAINFLVLPLYKRADDMQNEERQAELRMKPTVDHIKKTFKGDERFMMLQTCYRQHNYKPTDALKGTVSLLLQIPFFIAAYNFLSSLQALNGFSFGPIKDLSLPDGLLVIGGLSINLLPILMTIINIISSVIYSKGMSVKSKVQMYVLALFFLVFLYSCPSGLVFYWTLNNVFSLAKNIFYKMKNPKLVLCICSSVASAGAIIYALICPLADHRMQFFLIAFLVLLQLPLLFYFLRKKMPQKGEITVTKKDHFIFYAGCVFMAILTGVLIPSALINSSAEEFINLVNFNSPLLHVLNSALLATGLFVIWFSIFYVLASPSGKKAMGLMVWILSVSSVIDYMFFGKGYGFISPSLQFENELNISFLNQFINFAILCGVAALLYLIWKKKEVIVRIAYIATAIAMVAMSCVNISNIHATVTEKMEQLTSNGNPNLTQIPLSKDGKNVVVLMLDRAVNRYFPFIMKEKPELQKQFAGFTYYPNTISYGTSTNTGVPGFFGGYEYIPTEMNKRKDELLKDKQNEALKVMPRLFAEHGFQSTICGPTYAGYSNVPDLTVFKDLPNVHACLTPGMYDYNAGLESASSDEQAALNNAKMDRNLFCYSIFKVAPLAVQHEVYDGGNYHALKKIGADQDTDHRETIIPEGQTFDGPFKATGADPKFMANQAILKGLSGKTQVIDGKKNTYFIMTNDTTHAPAMLQLPQYEAALKVDNEAYEKEHQKLRTIKGFTLPMDTVLQAQHYHVNMAAYIQLGQWFDHLRELGVYDNTRIIIVSDHGFPLHSFEQMRLGKKNNEDLMWFNPILLVKDFGSKELTMDTTFMTNADVAALSAQGLIKNPVNPYTGKPINSDAKKADIQYISAINHSNISKNHGTQFTNDLWYALHVKDGDIFHTDNWQFIDKEELPQ